MAASCVAAQSPAPAHTTCPIQQAAPPATDASRALRARDYPQAEALFRAQAKEAKDEASFADNTAGVVHALLSQNKAREAVDTATDALKLHPKNAVLLDAQGEAYFRRGETDRAAIAWNAAAQADLCNPQVHYDMARFFQLNAEYASAARQLAVAHQLSPNNSLINRARASTTRTETTEDRIARLTDAMERSEASPDTRASLQRTIDVLKAQSRGSCGIVNPQASAEIPIVSIANGPTDMYAAGLEVTLNGKKRRLELDTGASGLLLSRSVAQAAGLISEAESQGGGIGDQGLRKELLAHVDDIKIGGLEFHNCLVRILDKKNALDVDGLIGADVFSSYLVTLDIPGRMVKLAPLPKRPDEDAASTASLDTSGADVEAESTPRNRYIPPEWTKENWTKVFRSGHMLIFPTNINNGPTRLFLMDTGASNEGLVSIEAAKEVTGVDSGDHIIKGVSGAVNNVKNADDITIAFGGIREQLHNVPAIDLSSFTRGAGTEISGFIGFFTLRELVIDYRDSLVRIVYDPKHGFHRH